MAAGKLVTSTDPEYPPQSSLDANNDFIGFDIEVGREIAKRLGVEIEFVTPGWDVITAGNWATRWDVSVGSMTPTPARAICIIIPPTGNQFIAMLKDSSLVSAQFTSASGFVGEWRKYRPALLG